MQTTNSDFIDIMEKNHMEIPWQSLSAGTAMEKLTLSLLICTPSGNGYP